MQTSHYRFWPENLPKTLDEVDKTIFENLEKTSKQYPNKIGFHFYGEDYSFSQIYQEVINLSGYLQSTLKVKRGEKVLLFMQNSPQFIISFYAILRAEAIVVPINPMSTQEDLEFFITDCDIKQAIVGQELYSKISELKETTMLKNIMVATYSDYINKEFSIGAIPEVVLEEKVDIPKAISWQKAINQKEIPSEYGGLVEDVALIPYTSGTTGLPKGCLHTHRTIQTNIQGSVLWFNKDSNSVALASLPMFHVSGLMHSTLAINFVGGKMIILTRWDREYTIKAIEKFHVSHWFNISTMIIDFLANPTLQQYDLSSMKMIGGGGASLPASVRERVYDRIGIQYIEAYGLTETISQTHLNPPENTKIECLGIPSFGVDSRIINPNTKEELGDEEEGELIVHGEQVFKGYFNRVEENKESFIEIDGKSFFRTGDIASRDKDGYYYLVDRLKRMINASGFKVWPTEVESKLHNHPAIQQVSVIGIPDPKRGETVKAFVILNESFKGKTTENEIIEWSKENMAAYKYPRFIEFRETLPTTSSGKILWKQLQKESQL